MIRIDLDSPEPLEDQLCKTLRSAIALREVEQGDMLPSVRQMASDLGIHWNTVARAYRRLQDSGLLSVRRGRGVFVKPIREAAEVDAQTTAKVSESIQETITNARLSGISLSAFRELALSEIKTWEARVS